MASESRPSLEVLHGDRLVDCYPGKGRDLVTLLAEAVAAHGNAPAVRMGEQCWSYRELDALATRLAQALAARGVTTGDRVVLFMGNRPEYLALLHAAWRLGAIAVPVGVRQSRVELQALLRHSGARAIVFEEALRARVPKRADAPDVALWVRLDGDEVDGETGFEAFAATGTPEPIATRVSEQSPACLMYTSGTTGDPKGALLSHLGFWHTGENYRRRFEYRAGDRFLLVIPASHISGLVAVVVACLRVAGCVVLQREFNATQVLDAIARHRITAAVMVPAMYNLCLLEPALEGCDLSSWRVGHFGGAPMPTVTIERLAARVPQLALYNGYGATETTSAVTLGLPRDAVDAPDTVGTILPCMDVRVLDEHGVEVPAGQAGELWIRSPGNAIGYWRNPEASRASFVAGYWRSGDVGSVDAQGRVRLLDRLKDLINRGGFKVYASELENHVLRLPGVIEAAAVASPCPVLGERVHVFLHADRAITLQELRDHCREALADYKTPDRLTQSDTPLPRNLNGKLSKNELRAQARELATTTSSH